MTAYLLVDLDVFDRTGYAEYPPKVRPLIEKRWGKDCASNLQDADRNA